MRSVSKRTGTSNSKPAVTLSRSRARAVKVTIPVVSCIDGVIDCRQIWVMPSTATSTLTVPQTGLAMSRVWRIPAAIDLDELERGHAVAGADLVIGRVRATAAGAGLEIGVVLPAKAVQAAAALLEEGQTAWMSSRT
jgi:hypothetical protein